MITKSSRIFHCFAPLFTKTALIATFFLIMMTSSNGNIFRVTGHLCREFTGPRWIPRTKASDAGLWFFFDLPLNKRLSKQSWGWWFETLSCPLWRHCNILCYHEIVDEIIKKTEKIADNSITARIQVPSGRGISYKLYTLNACLVNMEPIRICCLANIGIYIIKIRRYHDCLLFTKGIPIPRKTVFILMPSWELTWSLLYLLMSL